MDIALPTDCCMTGEVGLAGEIRPVNRIDQRIGEARKLGFSRILIPDGQKYQPAKGIQVIEVARVTDAVRLLFKQSN